MSYDRQVSRALDDEHRGNIALFERVERALAKSSPDTAELAQLAVALCRQIEQDVGRHFDFEERELFPRMTDAGDGEMAALLAAEHAAIRETATALLPLAQRAAEGNLDAAGLAAMKQRALDMIERQVAHIQKETMALLPMLDDLLDADDDRELAFAYAAE
ncbi:MAG TPA: hemerythrin domain-containing protein [Casimicrobiaceae bacterium]